MVAGIDFTVRLRSPMCVSSGRPRGGADAGVARSPDGTPVIPASTLKGAARDALVKALGAGVPPRELARVFGTSADDADPRPGVIRFSDAEPQDPRHVETQLVTTVALSERRTAIPRRLTTVEVVAPRPAHSSDPDESLVFRGRIWPAPTTDGPTDRALAVAACGMACVRHLGARTRRGWGEVEVALGPEADALRDAVNEVLGGRP